MNEWEVAATVLGFALIPCALVALLAEPPSGLAAMQVGSILLSTASGEGASGRFYGTPTARTPSPMLPIRVP